MTALTVSRLLSAKPFVPFTLYYGDTEFEIRDPKDCRLDLENWAFYVCYSSLNPPAFLKHLGTPASSRFVEILDLRLVGRITIESGKLPE